MLRHQTAPPTPHHSGHPPILMAVEAVVVVAVVVVAAAATVADSATGIMRTTASPSISPSSPSHIMMASLIHSHGSIAVNRTFGVRESWRRSRCGWLHCTSMAWPPSGSMPWNASTASSRGPDLRSS